MDPEAKHRREETSAEAALWVVRLAERPSDSALKADFERWRAQGPEYELVTMNANCAPGRSPTG